MTAIRTPEARACIHRARDLFNTASAVSGQFNQDQIDYIRECAHDACRDAREHIRNAAWASAKRSVSRMYPRIGAAA